MKKLIETFSIILLLTLSLTTACTSEKNKIEDKKEVKQKTEKKLTDKEINPRNKTDFQEINIDLFENPNAYTDRIFLCKSNALGFIFYNSFSGELHGGNRFSPKFLDGKFYAAMEGKPLTIFELTIPAKDLPRMEGKSLTGYSFYFRFKEIEYFLDDFEDYTTCYDDNDIEFESIYFSENMIYRKVKGSLMQLFKP